MEEKKLVEAVEEYMNSKVRERGYYNMLTAQSYAGDEDYVFNKEGTAARQWRSRVYRQMYSMIADVKSGKRISLTAEDVIKSLPTLEW